MDLTGRIGAELRSAALLEAAEANLEVRRQAGADQLRIAGQWATTYRRTMREHPDDERDTRRIGASSYPVHEYASGELAIAWEIHPLAAQRQMADAVDLEHRHPHTWRAVQTLKLDAWVARKIVALTRDLDYDQARSVDAEIADRLALPPSRLLTVVEARVVAADRAAAEEKWHQAATERTVHLARESEHGTRNLFARLHAADALRLDAAIDQVAGLLPTDDDDTRDQRRATALGILADPRAALDLLAGRTPAGRSAVVYVHTTPEQLAHGGGVARVEELGPFTRTMLADLLGPDARISLRPVIDLDEGMAADCYEIPVPIAERVHLTRPADIFPWATSTRRGLDLDHTLAYRPGGPPGQTSVDALAKLNRRHHRLKTHARGWHLEALGPNRYRWTTPRGRRVIVGPSGTRREEVPRPYAVDVCFVGLSTAA